MSNYKHGMHRTKIYGIWGSMVSRCHNPARTFYKYYGARGIFVCDKWRSFEGFFADMGLPPDGMTLERVDNEKGYSPDNCIWATRKAQSRNRRGIRFVVADGVSRSVAEWSEITGLSISTICARLKKGWDESQAIKTPKITNKKGIPKGEKYRDYAFGADRGVVWSEKALQEVPEEWESA